MRPLRYENIDVIGFLEDVVEKNTLFHKGDFNSDRNVLTWESLVFNKPDEDRRFLFMSREHGTYCFPEKLVFSQETFPNSAWTYYAGSGEGATVKAFAIELDKSTDGNVTGCIYELDYEKHVKHVEATAQKDWDKDELKSFLKAEHKERVVGTRSVLSFPERKASERGEQGTKLDKVAQESRDASQGLRNDGVKDTPRQDIER